MTEQTKYFQMSKQVFFDSIETGLAGLNTDEAEKELESVKNTLNNLWDGLLAREFKEELLSVVVGTTGEVVGEVHIFYMNQEIGDEDTPDMFPKDDSGYVTALQTNNGE